MVGRLGQVFEPYRLMCKGFKGRGRGFWGRGQTRSSTHYNASAKEKILKNILKNFLEWELIGFSGIFAFREGLWKPSRPEKRRTTASLFLYVSKHFQTIHMSLVLSERGGVLDKPPGTLKF